MSIEHIAAYVQINSPLKSYEQLISDKHKYNVGVTRGSIHLDVAEQIGFPYIVTFTKRKKLFDMLKHNKLDAIIYTHALTHYYCSKVFNIKGGQCVRQLGKPIEKIRPYILFMIATIKAPVMLLPNLSWPFKACAKTALLRSCLNKKGIQRRTTSFGKRTTLVGKRKGRSKISFV